MTSRQLEIVVLFGKGHPSKQIAEKLSISPLTVCWHKKAILQTSGKGTMVEVLVECMKSGSIRLEDL